MKLGGNVLINFPRKRFFNEKPDVTVLDLIHVLRCHLAFDGFQTADDGLVFILR